LARKAVAPDASASSSDRILQAAKNLFATQGYESTSTVAIARLAGTSESQMMKHFGSKEGLLEAIFVHAWHRINSGLRRGTEGVSSPVQKLQTLVALTLSALKKDRDLKLLLLLEGRRIRKAGQMVLLDRGFQDFVQIADEVLREMQASGQVRSDLNIECVRSALMGAIEGLLRDQLLAELVGFPARYRDKDVQVMFETILASLSPPR
jgi:AcrR family transcriptional regulator